MSQTERLRRLLVVVGLWSAQGTARAQSNCDHSSALIVIDSRESTCERTTNIDGDCQPGERLLECSHEAGCNGVLTHAEGLRLPDNPIWFIHGLDCPQVDVTLTASNDPNWTGCWWSVGENTPDPWDGVWNFGAGDPNLWTASSSAECVATPSVATVTDDSGAILQESGFLTCEELGVDCLSDRCSAGSTPSPVASSCGAVGWQGVCNGTTLQWCDGGMLYSKDCAADGKTCALSADGLDSFECVVDCGQVDTLGNCDGTLLTYCENGSLVSVDCSVTGDACGFDATLNGYNCVTQ